MRRSSWRLSKCRRKRAPRRRHITRARSMTTRMRCMNSNSFSHSDGPSAPHIHCKWIKDCLLTLCLPTNVQFFIERQSPLNVVFYSRFFERYLSDFLTVLFLFVTCPCRRPKVNVPKELLPPGDHDRYAHLETPHPKGFSLAKVLPLSGILCFGDYCDFNSRAKVRVLKTAKMQIGAVALEIRNIQRLHIWRKCVLCGSVKTFDKSALLISAYPVVLLRTPR